MRRCRTWEAEARTAQLDHQFRVTVESSPTGMLLLDRRLRIALANPALARMFGYHHSDLTGRSISALMPGSEGAAEALFGNVLDAERAPRRQDAGRETAGVDKQGRALSLDVLLALVTTVEGEFVLATVTDVGEARQLERARNAQALAQRLLDAEEAQRSRMAHEIHDALGQALTALTLDIAWVAEHLPAHAVTLQARTREMASLATRTIDDVRRLSAELSPAILVDQGLLAAMRWQVADFEKRSGLRCSLDLPHARLAWAADRSIAVFRVLQESLTNVARHAQARSVTVTLRLESRGDTVLEVSDDGCGFDPAQDVRAGARGLQGMQERAALYGGSLTVAGPAGGGSTVTLRLPWGSDETLSPDEQAPEHGADAAAFSAGAA